MPEAGELGLIFLAGASPRKGRHLPSHLNETSGRCQSESSRAIPRDSSGFPLSAGVSLRKQPPANRAREPSPTPEGPLPPVPATSVRELSRQWTGHLAHFRRHRNDEHLEALTAEALRYGGLHLENDLTDSPYWSKAPLARRVALLLFLVDRGVVARVVRQGRMAYEAQAHAIAWVAAQPSLATYLAPTLEFLAALQADQSRRARSAQS